jgi:hypothetical protein
VLYLGDCQEQLNKIDSDSIDALVTDPPAGISFMGKAWDSDKGGRDAWIAWLTQIMIQCFAVMKPGAHGLVWSLPRTSHWTALALENAGFEIRDCITHLFGSGFPKSHNLKGDWQGFGTALKPAVEFWHLIRKPISEKTVAANVLKWGTGALNIDASRIELSGNENLSAVQDGRIYGDGEKYGTAKQHHTTPTYKPTGRFPANLVLSHDPECEDDWCTLFCAVRMLDDQTKDQRAGKPSGSFSCRSKREITPNSQKPIQDRGALTKMAGYENGPVSGASRFFYCAKSSKADRNSGLPRGEVSTHPTVKSTKLMEYLITLITPPNGTILDPFMGSGSTGVAAKRKGFDFIGIEQYPEYFEIAKKRID